MNRAKKKKLRRLRESENKIVEKEPMTTDQFVKEFKRAYNKDIQNKRLAQDKLVAENRAKQKTKFEAENMVKEENEK